MTVARLVEDDSRLEPAVIAATRGRLSELWRDPTGASGWLAHIDHKSIGRRILVTTFVFFGLGGVLAALMRIQLAAPGNAFLGPDLYNQIFTVHGTTMMFLFAVPVMQGFGVYLVPLMVGARAIAYPRLVAFGYWMLLAGGTFLYVMLVLDVGPDNGWFSYVPLAGPEFSPGKRADVWAQLITFTELSALVVAVSLITTILKLRAPGMALNRMPLFVWATLVTSFMVVFAMPSVMLASTSLILDRLVSTHFYNQAEGGDPILYQHLFWYFGHPEVYIIFLPALGMMSEIVQTFAGRPVFGYLALVLSLVATAFIGFGVWVHHMFSMGLSELGQGVFSAASLMISLPTGVQIFCWIATLWSGRLRFATPLYYALAFFVVFTIGGMTGVMVAAFPLDIQVHDTFFVVAHLHYVLIGGSVFPLLGAVHYWYPKITGRMPSERLGRVSFWLFFIGFNLTFFPMHVLGLIGMPRRVYTYQGGLGWDTLNLVASIGVLFLIASLVIYAVNVVRSLCHGAVAGDDPWGAPSLEWATSSPPPGYNFEPLPAVTSREPLWNRNGRPIAVAGLSAERREVLVTHVMDAEPDHVTAMPSPSRWPLAAALAVTFLFIRSIFTPWAVVYGSVPVLIALIGWFWPREAPSARETEAVLPGTPELGRP